MPTALSKTRLAVARLRRTTFPAHLDEGRGDGTPAYGDKKYPIPYVADVPSQPTQYVRHASIKRAVLTEDGVRCQVCGEALLADDARIWLITMSHAVEVRAPRDTFLARHPQINGILSLNSNVGPLHAWCARVSLRFCPELKVEDPEWIVAWRCDIDPMTLRRRISVDYGGLITQRVRPEQLMTLNELDELIAEQKKLEA